VARTARRRCNRSGVGPGRRSGRSLRGRRRTTPTAPNRKHKGQRDNWRGEQWQALATPHPQRCRTQQHQHPKKHRRSRWEINPRYSTGCHGRGGCDLHGHHLRPGTGDLHRRRNTASRRRSSRRRNRATQVDGSGKGSRPRKGQTEAGSLSSTDALGSGRAGSGTHSKIRDRFNHKRDRYAIHNRSGGPLDLHRVSARCDAGTRGDCYCRPPKRSWRA